MKDKQRNKKQKKSHKCVKIRLGHWVTYYPVEEK